MLVISLKETGEFSWLCCEFEIKLELIGTLAWFHLRVIVNCSKLVVCAVNKRRGLDFVLGLGINRLWLRQVLLEVDILICLVVLCTVICSLRWKYLVGAFVVGSSGWRSVSLQNGGRAMS